MKILYVAASPVPSLAAKSVHVMKMAQALAKGDHDVTLITPEYNRAEPGPCQATQIHDYYGAERTFRIKRTHGIARGRVGRMLHVLQVLAQTLSFRPDLIYSRCFFSAVTLTVLGCPVIFERHDSFRDKSSSAKLFSLISKRRSLKAVVVISKPLKAYLVEHFPIPADKVFIAPDGADILKPDSAPPALGDFALNVGYVGHLYSGRGIDIILELAARIPAYGFHIIGGTPKDLAYWTAQAGHLKNVVFYGHLSHKEAARYLPALDVLLAPYQNKVEVSGGGGDTSKWMSPLKIFEYMSAAKPIICSDIPVLREVLHDRVNSILCAPDDAAAWESALRILTKDRAWGHNLGKQAQSDFLEFYTWDARAKNVLDFVAT